MGIVYDNKIGEYFIDFEERRELVLLKALMVWVKTRFTIELGIKYEKSEVECIQQISAIDQMKKVAFISHEDAWIIEQNVVLYNAVAKMFLHELLPKEIFANFGDCRFNANRRGSIVDIATLPVSLSSNVVTDVHPCTMYILKHDEMIKRYEESSIYNDKNVDIIPLLKSKVGVLLTKKDHKTIEEYFHKYKVDSDVLEAKNTIIERKEMEDKNLNAALKVINSQGRSADTLKLAVTLHTLIDSTFKTGHTKISRITYDIGGSTPVPDYSRLFLVKYDADLNEIKSILEPIIDPDIKIKLGDGKILFTTASGMDPDDSDQMANIVSATFFSEKTLDHVFETTVGPLVSVQDINRIREKYLQQRYNR